MSTVSRYCASELTEWLPRTAYFPEALENGSSVPGKSMALGHGTGVAHELIRPAVERRRRRTDFSSRRDV